MLLQIFRHVLSLVAASSCKSGGGMLLQKLLTSGGMVLQTGSWEKKMTVHPKHSVIAGPGCWRTSLPRILSAALDAAVRCDGPRLRRRRGRRSA
jgi:hypothetical protein